MKDCKPFFILLLLIIFESVSINAQNNFAYINTELLISQMEESKLVNEELIKLGEKYDEEFRILYTEYDTKRKKYESEASSNSASVNSVRAHELSQMEDKMQEFSKRASDVLHHKKNELMKPVLAKMNKAIEEVAEENGIDFVIDTAKNELAYTNNKLDLIEKVKKKLGID